MPTSLQYPLERSRALNEKWARLLQGTAETGANRPHGSVIIASAMPPRDPDADEEEEEEDENEDKREPAVIREPDEDE
jgi:hypothetical protein